MTEIYTPKAWLSLFGGAPRLRIDDNGDIYTYEESTRIFGGTPCGRIDFTKGYIYGSDYANFSPRPIGMLKICSDGVHEIYGTDYANFSAKPILYIKGDKIYTAEEYFRILGGNPSAYIKKDSPAAANTYAKQQTAAPAYTNSSSAKPQKMPGLFKLIIGCIVFLLIFSTVHNPIVFAPIGVGVVIGLIAIYFIHKKRTGASSYSKQTYQAPQQTYQPKQTYQTPSAVKAASTSPVTKTAAAAPSAPQKKVAYCKRCSVAYYPTVADNGLCPGCQKVTAQTAAKPVQPTAAAAKPTTGTPLKYNFICMSCGKTYQSLSADPGDSLCLTCRKAKKNGAVAPARPQPAPTPSLSAEGEAQFVSKAGKNSIFACPFCKGKMLVPNGQSNLSLKCSSCGKMFSVRKS